MADLTRPLIIIGAGRSGTTLLDAVLDAHPDIAMRGEFQFTVSRLWHQFWDIPAASAERDRRIKAFMAEKNQPLSSDDADEAIYRFVREEETQRTADIIKFALDQFYEITALKKPRWGFKEIWMGSDGDHTWLPYDAVFPDAHYVHIVRDPYDYARSHADWLREPLTLDRLRQNLINWVQCFAKNRPRRETGRYHLISYEAMVASPESVLTPLLQAIGLDWHEAMKKPFGHKILASGYRSSMPEGGYGLYETIPDLAAFMALLNYPRPPETAFCVDAPDQPAVGRAAHKIGDNLWQLNAPFISDGGHAWVSKIFSVGDLAPLGFAVDTLEETTRSPLRLYEDGQLLGPPHALHARIRAEGRGAYSHWGDPQSLRFSASDNTDPNQNGRIYTLGF